MILKSLKLSNHRFSTNMALLVFILGAFFNRIRGGWLFDLAQTSYLLRKIIIHLNLMEETEIKYVKDLNAIVYGLVFGALTNIYWSPIFYLSMRAAFSFGWGGYISAMIDRKIDFNRSDVVILDKLFLKKNHPVLSGFIALSFRGLIASIILSIPFYFFTAGWVYISLLGFAMGTIYLLACEICERVTFRGNGWQWGEVVFGGYLWSTIYLLV